MAVIYRKNFNEVLKLLPYALGLKWLLKSIIFNVFLLIFNFFNFYDAKQKYINLYTRRSMAFIWFISGTIVAKI